MRKKWLVMTFLALSLTIPAHLALAQGLAQGEAPQANGSAAEGSQPGLLTFDPQQAIWVLAIFIILVIVLYRTAWKNVLAGLKSREDRIRADIAAAEAARLKAEGTLRDYARQLADAEAKVRDILTKAGADAEKVAQSIRMQAQNDSEEIKERATREIEAARDQAVREVYEQGATLATTVAEKILRRSINADDQRDLVARALDQMQSLHQ